MSFIQDRIAAWAQRLCSADIVERSRLEGFLTVRLGFTAIVLMATPLWLVVDDCFTIWECVGFLALLTPFISIVALNSCASLATAQTISACGPLVLGAVIYVATQGHAGLAFCCLMLGVLEAMTAGLRRLAIGAMLIALTAILAAAWANGFILPTSAHFDQFVGVVLLIGYACAMGWSHARTIAIRNFRERRATMRHEALAQTIGDLVLRQERNGVVVHASHEATQMFGLSPSELLGRGFFERIHVADRPTFLKAISDACDSAQTITASVRLRRGHLIDAGFEQPETQFAWIEMRVRAMPLERRKDDPQDSAAVVTIVRDVTRAKLAESEISLAREAAERANVWKDRFLANVSHELRTPLNAIIGFAEILGNPDLAPADPARRMEYAHIIHSSGQHLLEMVNSILDMSKIDAGSFDILPEAFDLPPLLDQCCDMMGLKAAQAQVELVRAYPSRLEELVADKRACKQIIINLLSNAVKFTPPGGRVTLSARPEGGTFVISVADTGIGINAADLKHIGDPFFQAQKETTRAFEGTGLGLSLVRGLIGLHQGAIAIESEPRCGTIVTIRLPAHCTAQKENAPMARIETYVRTGVVSAHAAASSVNVVKKIA